MTNLRFIVAGVVVIVIGMVLFSSMYTVHQTRQALILEFGQPRNEEVAPGLHFKLPWQTATFYDKRVLSLDPPAQEIILSDQKRIIVDAFVRYLISSPKQFKLRANTEANFVDIFGGILNSRRGRAGASGRYAVEQARRRDEPYHCRTEKAVQGFRDCRG